MVEKIKCYVQSVYEEMLATERELCAIPAPSHFEHERAEYCRKKLESFGAEGVYIDEALNVIYPVNCDGSSNITVFVAHTDTVFPDRTAPEYHEDEDKIYCPGAGDDTASVVVLMYMARYYIENSICPPCGVMFVCNSCEEGLGNLKGTRRIFEDFEGRIARFISLDSASGTSVADRCVGSHRYMVEVETEGGHSYHKFGNANAINEIAKIVNRIYDIEIPFVEGERTTCNVGEICGGTSVNTVAQYAKMLCEYRSSRKECLEIMKRKFNEIFESAASEDVRVKVTLVGDRPCSNIDDGKLDELRCIISDVILETNGTQVEFESSSTDCNIPLSLGIPALCVGVFTGGGAHTRGEWILKESLKPGLMVAIRFSLALAEI